MTEQTENFGTALYYPYIHVQNENWLKCALLYWDRIRRIVPNELEDDALVNRYTKEGLLVDTNCLDYRDDAASLFKTHFLPVIEGDLRSSLADSSELLSELSMTVYNTKLCDALRSDLETKGFIERSGPWYRTVPLVGGYFMISLAAAMSEKINAPMITDTPAYQKASQYCLYGGTDQTESSDQTDDLLLQLKLPFPCPDSLADVPVSEIVKFRQKYNDERMRFREAVEELKFAFSKLEDENARLDFLNEKKQKIATAVQDHSRALESSHINTVSSAFQVSAPTVVTSAAALLPFQGAVSATILMSAGIIISSMTWWTKIRQDKRQLVKDCPWHYLLPLEKKFT